MTSAIFDPSRLSGRLFCLLLALAAAALAAQAQPPATTMVTGIVFRADGTPARGSVVISWPAFNTADGEAVAAGNLGLQLGEQGMLTVALVPNEGAAPAGVHYRVVFRLDDGSTSTENWLVPAAGPVTIAEVRTTVVPAGVAAQMASRSYVDTTFVRRSGDETIAGAKTFTTSPLVPEPALPAAAASKAYVDAVASGGVPDGAVIRLPPDGTPQTIFGGLRVEGQVAADATAAIVGAPQQTADILQVSAAGGAHHLRVDAAGGAHLRRLNSIALADHFASIQEAVDAAGDEGAVIIPPQVAGAGGSFLNTGALLDLRGGTFALYGRGPDRPALLLREASTGNVAARWTTDSLDRQNTLNFYMPGDDGNRIKQSFWAKPLGAAGNFRMGSWEWHPESDPYNPGNCHMTLYMTNAADLATNTLSDRVLETEWCRAKDARAFSIFANTLWVRPHTPNDNQTNLNIRGGATGEVDVQISLGSSVGTPVDHWRLRKSSDNHFSVTDVAAANRRLEFLPAGRSEMKPGAASGDGARIVFRRFDGTAMFDMTAGNFVWRLQGAGAYQFRSAANDTVAAISDAGVVSAAQFSGDLTGNVTGNVIGDLTGNAATATALAAAPALCPSGEVARGVDAQGNAQGCFAPAGGGGGGGFVLGFGAGGTQGGGTTRYAGTGVTLTGFDFAAVPAPQNLTAKKLRCSTRIAPGGSETLDCTLMTQVGASGSGSDTALTCTITGSATECSAGGTVAVNDDMIFAVKWVTSSGTAAALRPQAMIYFEVAP